MPNAAVGSCGPGYNAPTDTQYLPREDIAADIATAQSSMNTTLAQQYVLAVLINSNLLAEYLSTD